MSQLMVGLLQATATHIPLRAESVQCIVTSPPYWSLRSYQGEQRQTWGGDPRHEHHFEALPTAEGYTGTARWQHSNNGRGEEAPDEKRLRDPVSRYARPEAWGQIGHGGLCACGAWRGSLGLEPLFDCLAWARGEPPCAACYVCHIRVVFAELWGVLRSDGTCWLNLGDSYTSGNRPDTVPDTLGATRSAANRRPRTPLKPKDLIGVPWRVALALQTDGWWLRSDIVWAKPNPMPESVTDRPTKSHEYVFLLTKSARYFYDADGVRETAIHAVKEVHTNGNDGMDAGYDGNRTRDGFRRGVVVGSHRNVRSVWTIPTQAYPGSHFATFPAALAERCVLAGTSPRACGVCGSPWARTVERIGHVNRREPAHVPGRSPTKTDSTGWKPTSRPSGDWHATCEHSDDGGSAHCVVLDPFVGSGTVARVAIQHGRSVVGLDISREYLADHARRRVDKIQVEMGL